MFMLFSATREDVLMTSNISRKEFSLLPRIALLRKLLQALTLLTTGNKILQMFHNRNCLIKSLSLLQQFTIRSKRSRR